MTKRSWLSRSGHRLIAAAWLVHGVAWFLPVHKDGVVFPDGLPGWQALRVSLSAIWPSTASFYLDNWYQVVLGTVSGITTLLFLFGSPWVVLRGSPSRQRRSAWVTAIAFIVNTHWFVFDRSDLRIGYFLWLFSFLLLAIGLFVSAARHAEELAPARDQG
jgi:hypothetical protein